MIPQKVIWYSSITVIVKLSPSPANDAHKPINFLASEEKPEICRTPRTYLPGEPVQGNLWKITALRRARKVFQSPNGLESSQLLQHPSSENTEKWVCQFWKSLTLWNYRVLHTKNGYPQKQEYFPLLTFRLPRLFLNCWALNTQEDAAVKWLQSTVAMEVFPSTNRI